MRKYVQHLNPVVAKVLHLLGYFGGNCSSVKKTPQEFQFGRHLAWVSQSLDSKL